MLGELSKQIRFLDKIEFGHVGRTIVDLQKHLKWLELQPTSPQTIRSLKNTKIKLNCWLEKENAMWLQRSCINWFQSGDRNTRFFHVKALARDSKNLIYGLMDLNDVWQEEEDKVQGIVFDYFMNLFYFQQLARFTRLFKLSS